MAYVCSRRSISPLQAEKIRSILTFIPKAENTKYGTPGQPINFWLTETCKNANQEEELFIRLPFLFAAAFFRICPNLDLHYPAHPVTFTGTLRPDQVPIIETAWQHLQDKGTTTLGLPPGKGKTVLGTKLACFPPVRGLRAIVVHRDVLLTQWLSTITNNTDAKVWIVGEKEPATYSFIICLGNRWRDIPPATRAAVGFLIIDEAHCFCTPGFVEALLAFTPQYIVVETATLQRSDGMHSMIQAMVGTHGVFEQAQLSFLVYRVSTGIVPQRSFDERGRLEWSKILSSTIYAPGRDQLILQLVKFFPQKSILVLTGLREHALALHALFLANSVTSDCLCGKKNSYAEAHVLVGTISKIGTGFDQGSACATFSGKRFNLLILASTIKKTSLLTQNVGRVFRCENPLIFHLSDADPIYTRHWREARKWYTERGATIRDLKVPLPSLAPEQLEEQIVQHLGQQLPTTLREDSCRE